MDQLFGIGMIAFIGATLIVWASFFVPGSLGRFKPVPLLLALFACYNIVPFMAVVLLSDLAEPMLGSSFDYYGAERMNRVGLLVLGCALAGLIGQVGTSHGLRKERPSFRSARRFSRKSMRRSPIVAGSFAALTIVAFALVWQLRRFLLAGYHEAFGDDQSEVLLRGSLSSIFSLLFVSYLFLWFADSDQTSRPSPRSRWFWMSTIILALVAAALLSLGGRLYVASAVLTMIALHLSRGVTGERWRWRSMAGAATLLLFAAAVGIWRTQGEVSGFAVLVNLLGEPLFVSISLASLLASDASSALSFPSFLIGDVVGLLPSVVYPEKLDRLFSVSSAYPIVSPLGGLNGLASLIANFGWLGAVIAFGVVCAAVSWGSRIVSRRRVGPRMRLVYVIAVTMPLLSLLRDPFVISVYKNLLQNAVAWPLLLAAASSIRLTNPRRRATIESVGLHGVTPLAPTAP